MMYIIDDNVKKLDMYIHVYFLEYLVSLINKRKKKLFRKTEKQKNLMDKNTVLFLNIIQATAVQIGRAHV